MSLGSLCRFFRKTTDFSKFVMPRILHNLNIDETKNDKSTLIELKNALQ